MCYIRLILTAALLVSPSSSFASPTNEVMSFSDGLAFPAGPTTPFHISANTQVPGHQLKAGDYSITVIDHLSDRMVVRVADSSGKELATFIALPGGNRLAKGSGEGPIEMASKGTSKTALRGFTFSDGSVAEFVYPKTEAVELAKTNSTTIPAVDPASEGRVASPDLSRTDMELVTLWMLTPTLVGADRTPAMEAKRYQDTATSQPVVAAAPVSAPTGVSAAAPIQVAAVTPPAPVISAPRPRQVAHPVASLPHTASNLPGVILFGSFTLLAAAFLNLRRNRVRGNA